MFSFLSWIIFGLIVGALAKFVMPGKDGGGILTTILLGIAGGMLGGWIGSTMGYGRNGEPAGWLMSILGAVLILAAYKMFFSSARTA